MPSTRDSDDGTPGDETGSTAESHSETDAQGGVLRSRRHLLGAAGGALAVGGLGGYLLGARPFAPPDCDTAPVSVEDDEWSFPNYDRRRTAAAPADAAPDSLTTRWSVEWEAFRYDPPAVANDSVFVAKEDGSARQTLHAFDVHTGTELWHTKYREGGDAYSVVAAGDTVYYHTFTEERGRSAFALAMSDGRERWVSSLDAGSGPPPTLVPTDGLVVLDDSRVDRDRTRLYALDRLTGERCWQTVVDSDALSPTPAIADGRAYYTAWTTTRGDETAPGALYELETESGELRRQTEIPRGADGPPVLGDDLAYVPAFNGPLVAVSRHTGDEIWRHEQTELFGEGEAGREYAQPSYELGALTSDALVARLQAFTDAPDRLRAFDPKTGEVLWERIADGTDAWFTPPTAAGDEAFVAENRDDDVSNRLLRLDATTGDVVETVPVDGWVHHSPVFAEGDAVFATGSGLRVFGPA